MLLRELYEGKMMKQTASNLYAQLENLKKSIKNPSADQRKMFDNLKSKADSLMTSEMKAKEKDFEAKHSGSDWWELGKKLYPMTQKNGQWVVKSTAKEWKGEKEWSYDHKFEAMEQVEKLMKYKDHDRDAGHGDRDRDLEKWTKD